MRCVRLLSCLLLAATAACWRASTEPRSFEISRTSPDLGSAAEPLLLNDTVTVYFSEPVQPVSVTADSVTVVDDEGQKVPGSLRVGSNWVSFVPEPPLAADLADGSFRPGAKYRLMIAGSPRPDAVRSADGRRLSAARTYELRIADRDEVPPGHVSLLRPLATDVPFLLRPPEVPEMLPADAPRLRLHFTLPILPTSVSADAFTLRLLPGFEVLRPRGVRVVSSRLDEWPGSTVEIDLGSLPRLHSSGETVSLGPGDWVSVELVAGPTALTDYAGNQPLPGSPQCWSVVEGRSLALAEWPSGETSFPGDDPVMPCFEARSGSIRPRVRVEAGDGSLGVFRPQRDTTLRPGVPFDRGDGQVVASRGSLFPFLAVDIPAGVTVAIDASGGAVHIVVCGGIRIDGIVEIAGESAPMVRRFETPAAELVESAQVAMLAAGDVLVRGVVRTLVPPPADGSPLTLASAGRMHLHGELPFHTILGVEAPGAEQGEQAIVGARGQTVVVPASFRYGLAAGADFWVRGFTSWRELPIDRDGGVVVLRDADPQLLIAWQAAPADSVRTDSPDLRLGRLGRPQAVRDRDVITAGPSAFVRFELSARVSHGAPLPQVRELRLEDR